MDIETLATKAGRIFANWPMNAYDHGLELARGFFTVYNIVAGQSRHVLYHPKSDLIFKDGTYWSTLTESNSNQNLAVVTLYGREFTVRFPRIHTFETKYGAVEVQEFVNGESDPCVSSKTGFSDAWCEHADILAKATGLCDTHTGNWKIVGNEIVIFDC